MGLVGRAMVLREKGRSGHAGGEGPLRDFGAAWRHHLGRELRALTQVSECDSAGMLAARVRLCEFGGQRSLRRLGDDVRFVGVGRDLSVRVLAGVAVQDVLSDGVAVPRHE